MASLIFLGLAWWWLYGIGGGGGGFFPSSSNEKMKWKHQIISLKIAKWQSVK